MARKSRNMLISDFYHIMVQGDEKKYIFETIDSKKKFIYLLKRNAFRNDVKIIAYCVMDNHVHILLHSNEIERISKMMSQCNTAFGLYYIFIIFEPQTIFQKITLIIIKNLKFVLTSKFFLFFIYIFFSWIMSFILQY